LCSSRNPTPLPFLVPQTGINLSYVLIFTYYTTSRVDIWGQVGGYVYKGHFQNIGRNRIWLNTRIYKIHVLTFHVEHMCHVAHMFDVELKRLWFPVAYMPAWGQSLIPGRL